jgi:hypothetical protein
MEKYPPTLGSGQYKALIQHVIGALAHIKNLLSFTTILADAEIISYSAIQATDLKP